MVFVVDDYCWLVARQHLPDFPKERRSVQNTVRIPNTLLYGWYSSAASGLAVVGVSDCLQITQESNERKRRSSSG